MSFWDIASEIGKAAKKDLIKKYEETQKEIEKKFREHSDQEIERAYRNRYDNPNVKTEWQLEIIENEAHRRGIY